MMAFNLAIPTLNWSNTAGEWTFSLAAISATHRSDASDVFDSADDDGR